MVFNFNKYSFISESSPSNKGASPAVAFAIAVHAYK